MRSNLTGTLKLLLLADGCVLVNDILWVLFCRAVKWHSLRHIHLKAPAQPHYMPRPLKVLLPRQQRMQLSVRQPMPSLQPLRMHAFGRQTMQPTSHLRMDCCRLRGGRLSKQPVSNSTAACKVTLLSAAWLQLHKPEG